MRINLLEVPAISVSLKEFLFKGINLYPYPVAALDIYVTSELTKNYQWLMETSEITDPYTNITSSVSKFSIDIDGHVYPLQAGSPGESPTNPIIWDVYWGTAYTPDLYSRIYSKFIIGTRQDEDFNELQIEKDDNIGSRAFGTNVISDDDYIPMKIIVNDTRIIDKDTYPYGGHDNTSGQSFDGYGGLKIVGNDKTQISAYGGTAKNDELNDIILVIQKSQFADDTGNINENKLGARTYGIRY